MSIKAVIWDIGGVIARTENLAPRNQLAAALGVTRDRLNYLFFSGPEGTRAQTGQITAPELMTYIRGELGLSAGEIPDLQERFFGGDQVDPALVDFIRALRPRYKVGIISNAWSQLLDLLESWGIKDAFDVIIGSGDVGVMKPDPRIYQLALDGLDVLPHEAVFVDDFIENIQGAEALGINAIHFQNTPQALGELKEMLGLE
jgi:epoxide hydrolase-like predicted phosphatase